MPEFESAQNEVPQGLLVAFLQEPDSEPVAQHLNVNPIECKVADVPVDDFNPGAIGLLISHEPLGRKPVWLEYPRIEITTDNDA